MLVYALLDFCAKVFSSLCSGPSYSHCWELCKAPRYWELCSAHTTNLCECRPAASLLSLGGHCLVPLQAYPRSWGCPVWVPCGGLSKPWLSEAGCNAIRFHKYNRTSKCNLNCASGYLHDPSEALPHVHPNGDWSATAVIKPAWLAQAQTRTAKRCHNEQCAQP